MELNLTSPPVLQGNEREQLLQIRSYLIQMQRQLVVAMEGIKPQQIAEDVAIAIRGSSKKLPDGGAATIEQTYNTLKSLIIKNADTVTNTIQEINTRLESDYVATSTFGEYAQQAANTMTATATEVVQSYNFESQLTNLQNALNDANNAVSNLENALNASGTDITNLQSYNITTEQYIKTGLLYFDDNNIPRYGVAVGENLTKVVVNGETVIERTGLAATFTSNRLSFWQNNVEVAYVSDNTLFIQEARILARLFLGNWVIETTNGFTLKWVGV